MLRRGGNTRHSRGGPALLISSYHADARASSHVNLEIVTCATGIEGAYRFRDAAAQQGAKKRTAEVEVSAVVAVVFPAEASNQGFRGHAV